MANNWHKPGTWIGFDAKIMYIAHPFRQKYGSAKILAQSIKLHSISLISQKYTAIFCRQTVEKNKLEQNPDIENYVYPLQQRYGRGRILSQCIKLHSINLIFLEKKQIFQKISSLKEFEYNATNFLVL